MSYVVLCLTFSVVSDVYLVHAGGDCSVNALWGTFGRGGLCSKTEEAVDSCVGDKKKPLRYATT